MWIRAPKGWEIDEREVTPEHCYLNRRALLKAAGFLTLEGLLQAAVKRNAEFNPDIRITEEWAATGYNNFYEFNAENKQAVKNEVAKFVTSPWTLKVDGLVAKPLTLDVDDMAKTFPVEERVYRHRCVEAWSMVVPWSGFPLAEVIKRAQPKPEAMFVRFVTAKRPDQMPGINRYNWYPWPYFEALRMDEAMNPLCMVVTGLYGKPLPKQNGAPVRIVTPWKYGYKSPKSIERIEFVARKPATFWNQLQPAEYGFYSNVNPGKPHPRWSQATEKVLPNMERRATELYNGYGKWVAAMYTGKED
jgi:sulfoxide reductase catalytic subunit YedY